MTAILVQFKNESVEVDDVEKHRVLTALEVIYQGGSLDGKTADFPTRDLERVVVGLQNCFDVSGSLSWIRPTFKNERGACIRTQERRFLLALEA